MYGIVTGTRRDDCTTCLAAAGGAQEKIPRGPITNDGSKNQHRTRARVLELNIEDPGSAGLIWAELFAELAPGRFFLELDACGLTFDQQRLACFFTECDGFPQFLALTG